MNTNNPDTKEKKQVEVVIGGKTYKLATYDNIEYIKSVAAYVDEKYNEIAKSTDSITRMSDQFSVMLALNITDDLFKEALKDKKAAVNARVGSLNKTVGSLEQKLSELEQKLKELEDEKEALINAKAEAEKKLFENNAELEASKTSLIAKDALLKGFEENTNNLKEENDKNAIKIKNLDDDNTRLSEKLRETEAENARNLAEIDALKEKIKNQEEQIVMLTQESESDEQDAADLEELIERLRKAEEQNKALSELVVDAGLTKPVPDKNGKIKDKDKDRKTLLKELNDIKSENGRTKKENKALSQRVTELEEEIFVLKNPVSEPAEENGQLVLTETEAPSKTTKKK